MQILAFDFGTKKIGVAVGQTLTKTSSPLTIIFNKKNKINWQEIEEVINEWNPDLLIVGKPLNMDGTESDIMKNVSNFVKKLKKISGTECEYMDERLTSFEAKEKVADTGSTLVDAHAAKIILDNWFNKSVDTL
jgi:putative Holliday junction resolvase|tara:strand:+ start:2075 stop:2476 length:402 start_codon:yes stop_codon:yes gene_type:complete